MPYSERPGPWKTGHDRFFPGLPELRKPCAATIPNSARRARKRVHQHGALTHQLLTVPSPIDQNSCAHWRNPRDMMRNLRPLLPGRYFSYAEKNFWAAARGDTEYSRRAVERIANGAQQ